MLRVSVSNNNPRIVEVYIEHFSLIGMINTHGYLSTNTIFTLTTDKPVYFENFEDIASP